jgi:hypothetical protein
MEVVIAVESAGVRDGGGIAQPDGDPLGLSHEASGNVDAVRSGRDRSDRDGPARSGTQGPSDVGPAIRKIGLLVAKASRTASAALIRCKPFCPGSSRSPRISVGLASFNLSHLVLFDRTLLI